MNSRAARKIDGANKILSMHPQCSSHKQPFNEGGKSLTGDYKFSSDMAFSKQTDASFVLAVSGDMLVHLLCILEAGPRFKSVQSKAHKSRRWQILKVPGKGWSAPSNAL